MAVEHEATVAAHAEAMGRAAAVDHQLHDDDPLTMG
jgi:hypothetical protein